MKHGVLIGSACLLALLSTVGASVAYPLLPPLFSSAAPNGLNTFLGLPPKLLFGVALMVGARLATGLMEGNNAVLRALLAQRLQG